MSNEMQIWRLRRRRRRLDERLREELGRSMPDPLTVQALRQRKRRAEHDLVLAEVEPAGRA